MPHVCREGARPSYAPRAHREYSEHCIYCEHKTISPSQADCIANGVTDNQSILSGLHCYRMCTNTTAYVGKRKRHVLYCWLPDPSDNCGNNVQTIQRSAAAEGKPSAQCSWWHQGLRVRVSRLIRRVQLILLLQFSAGFPVILRDGTIEIP